MPYVRVVRTLVSPTKGDGDLRPGAIAGVGDSVVCVDCEHPMGGDFSISSALDSDEAPENSGDHFVVILEGVIVVPRWSATSGSVVVVVVVLFGLELLCLA